METKSCKGLPQINTEGLKSFIPESEIEQLLKKPLADKAQIRDIIAKSLSKQRLDPPEMTALLTAQDADIIAEIKAGAEQLKKNIYGNRIVLFAPLYVGNKCINDCTYCGYRSSNQSLERKTLSKTELPDEV